MIQSPINLQILLKIYYSPLINNPLRDTQAHKEAYEYLHFHGMIDRSDDLARVTDKGEFYIKHLMNIPFPERTYFIPDKASEEA